MASERRALFSRNRGLRMGPVQVVPNDAPMFPRGPWIARCKVPDGAIQVDDAAPPVRERQSVGNLGIGKFSVRNAHSRTTDRAHGAPLDGLG